MQLKDKIKICATCQNRKMDIKRGVVCSLTDEKPEFEVQCPEYNSDTAAIECQKDFEQRFGMFEQNDASIYGNSIKSSSWFYTIGWLSLINLAVSFFGIKFIFGLGITEILQVNLSYTLFSIPVWVSIIFMILLPLFYIFVGYLSSYRQDTRIYIIGAFVYLLDLIICITLALHTGLGSVAIDIICHIFPLVAFAKVLFDSDFQKLYKEQKCGWKFSHILSIAVILFQCYAIFATINIQGPNANVTLTAPENSYDTEDQYLREVVQEINNSRPMYFRDDNGNRTGVEEKWKFIDNKLCIVYTDFSITYDEYQELIKDIDEGAVIAKYKTSLIQTDAESLSFYKLIFDEGYDIVYQHYSSDVKLIFEIPITSEDVESAVGEF